MNRDKKTLLGLTVFICSLAMISIIKGTYAYPSSMENTSGGKVVPLGAGDEPSIKSVCFYCPSSGSYAWSKENEAPEDDCYQTANSQSNCHAPASTPTPTKTPTKTPTSTPTPTKTPTKTPIIPDEPDYEYPSCYVCSTDEKLYKWSKYSNLPNTCSGTWVETNKSSSECSYVPPVSPSLTPNSYCYVCSTNDNTFYWGLYPGPSAGSNSCSGSWKVTAKTYNQCRAEDIPSNPNTGDVMLYIAYLVGFSSLFYSGYSFYRYKKQNINK